MAGRFCIVFQMNKAREISNFKEYQTTFLVQNTKKVDPETFSSWVNDIFQRSKSCLISVDEHNIRKIVIKVFR